MREDLSTACSPERDAERFKAVERALVWCHQDENSLPYHLIDINQEGLSFRYLGKQLNPDSIHKVSLYHETTKLVENISVEPVSDMLLKDGLVPVRRASFLFKDMGAELQRNLEYFIRKYTDQI
jgi:hypothetical protein